MKYGPIPDHLKKPIRKAADGNQEALSYLRGAAQVYRDTKTGELLRKVIKKCTTST